jgi:hypothetical protein
MGHASMECTPDRFRGGVRESEYRLVRAWARGDELVVIFHLLDDLGSHACEFDWRDSTKVVYEQYDLVAAFDVDIVPV